MNLTITPCKCDAESPEDHDTRCPHFPGYPCQHCRKPTFIEQYDRYGIYAGRWHNACWARHGYDDFIFDPGYAGERLDED